MTDDNIAIIRQSYEAYERGDLTTVFSLFHPEIEIYQTELLPWGGQYKGHEQVQAFFHKLNQYTEAQPEPIDFIAAGDAIVVVGRLQGKARATERSFDMKIIHVWTVMDQKIIRFEAYIDTPAMLLALETP